MMWTMFANCESRKGKAFINQSDPEQRDFTVTHYLWQYSPWLEVFKVKADRWLVCSIEKTEQEDVALRLLSMVFVRCQNSPALLGFSSSQ